MRRVTTWLCLFCVAWAACGGNSGLSLDDYAIEVERLLVGMNSQLDTLDAEFRSGTITVPGAQRYQAARVEARRDFLEGFTALDRPPEVAELYDAALSALTALMEAEQALADEAAAATTLGQLDAIDRGPLRDEFVAADQQAIAICQAAQEAVNAGDTDLAITGPWVPEELRGVVSVAFGCTDEERGK